MTNNDKTKTIELNDEMIDALEYALEYALEMSCDDISDLSSVRMTHDQTERIYARHLALLRLMNQINSETASNMYEVTINEFRQNQRITR